MKSNKNILLEYTKELDNLEIPRIIPNLDSLLETFNNTSGDQNKFYLNFTFTANINSKEIRNNIINLKDNNSIKKNNINIYWKDILYLINNCAKEYEIITNSLDKNKKDPIDICDINWGKNWTVNLQNTAHLSKSKSNHKVKQQISNKENLKIYLTSSVKWSNDILF